MPVCVALKKNFLIPLHSPGAIPPPMFPIPPEVEDTPRTYRSDNSKKEDPSRVDPDSSPLSTEATIEALDNTFTFFKRAVVSMNTHACVGAGWMGLVLGMEGGVT